MVVGREKRHIQINVNKMGSVTYLRKGKLRCSGHSEKGNVNYNEKVRTDFRKKAE